MNITDKIYHDENAARAHLEAVRWPTGVTCPHCGCTDKCQPTPMVNRAIPAKEPKKGKNGKLIGGTKGRPAVAVDGWYYCGDCLEKFTVRTGMVYERSHVPLHKWVLATHLMCSSKKGMSAHQLHRMLGVTYKTAWFMAHRIREAMIDVGLPPMGGEGKNVQADETYIGSKKVKPTVTTSGRPFTKGGKSGGNFKNAVVALVSEGKARAFHVDRADADTVADIIRNNVSRDTELRTDESRLYTRVGREYAGHEKVNHSKGEYVRNGVTTNNVENFFSVFKRGMIGTYQHCSEKHLGRYVQEFTFRHNRRDMTDAERALEALKGAEGKRLTYQGRN